MRSIFCNITSSSLWRHLKGSWLKIYWFQTWNSATCYLKKSKREKTCLPVLYWKEKKSNKMALKIKESNFKCSSHWWYFSMKVDSKSNLKWMQFVQFEDRRKHAKKSLPVGLEPTSPSFRGRCLNQLNDDSLISVSYTHLTLPTIYSV